MAEIIDLTEQDTTPIDTTPIDLTEDEPQFSLDELEDFLPKEIPEDLSFLEPIPFLETVEPIITESIQYDIPY